MSPFDWEFRIGSLWVAWSTDKTLRMSSWHRAGPLWWRIWRMP